MHRDFGTIRPHPIHTGDLALAKRHGKAHRIAVFLDCRLRGQPFATTRLGHIFLELRGPDDVPTHPHPAKDLRNWLTLARRAQPQPVQSPSLDRPRPAAEHPLVNRPAQRGPRKPAHCCHGQPKHRPAKAAAQRSTRRRKYQCRHRSILPECRGRQTAPRCAAAKARSTPFPPPHAPNRHG